MKFSFMTWVCPEWYVEQILSAAKRYGYHGVEFRTDVNQRHGVEPDAAVEHLKAVKQAFADAGVEISCVATSSRFSFADSNERRQMVEQTKRHVELAEKLGCPYIRVFGGAIPKGVQKKDCKRYVADCLYELGEFAQPLGVSALLETHDDFSLAKDASETVRMANHPNVAILWDVQHPFTHGETIEETFGYLRDHVRHLHIHDCHRVDGRWELALLGEGEIPHDVIMAKLASINFQGHLSGEWIQPPWEPEVILEQYAKKLHEYMASLHR